MPTAIPLLYGNASARNFAVRGVAWSLGLFGLMRLAWFETQAVLPLTHLQGRIAAAGFGPPAVPVTITLACSGADALALCAAAILAYPASWARRLGGAAGGVGLILALNTVRIGTLGRAAGSAWFQALHVYVWPAILTVAIVGYVFAWMRLAGRPAAVGSSAAPRVGVPGLRSIDAPSSRRFVLLAAAFLVIFIATAPLYLENAAVLAVAVMVARAAAGGLHLLGMEATATGAVLATARGGFLVTQECICTPLIPVYLAAVLAYSPTWRWRAIALLAAIPLFVGLGVARLLVVALPGALAGSPIFAIHAFSQLLLGGIIVVVAALRCHGTGAAGWRRALLAGLVGYVCTAWLVSTVPTSWIVAQAGLPDPQGALALLPTFQAGLYLALFVAAFLVLRVRPLLAGLAVLGLSQLVLFAVLHAVVRLTGLTPHVRDVRAWALGAPVLVIAALVTHERSRH